MATWNKELQGLTLDEIKQVSERFLMGWHDPKYDGHNFRIKGLNHRREKYGLEPLTKEWSFQYRLDYIKRNYSEDEIVTTITEYLSNHLVADERWSGIELFDCRFGREYAKLFKQLVGVQTWRKISEQTRVNKLVETQETKYGGVGVGGAAAYDKMRNTKLNMIQQAMDEFRNGATLDDKVFGSLGEKIVFYLLVDKFGRDDVYYQYGVHPYDARYPYPCDFYIKSLDLFIELNLYYSHGHHWYDANSQEDNLRRQQLLMSDKPKVVNSVHVWCDVDVEKRRTAKANGLNYLVFWDGKYTQKGDSLKGYTNRPCLTDFLKWYVDYNCDYETFICDYPGNTY